MNSKLWALVLFFLGGTVFSTMLTPSPMLGLSSVLGTLVITSTLLGTSVLGSPVIGSSTLGSTGLGPAIANSYSLGIQMSAVLLAVTVVGLIAFTEISNPSYGRLGTFLGQLRASWVPVTAIASVLLLIQAAAKVLLSVH